MKKKSLFSIKNIFSIITIVWSAIMLIEYLLILMPIKIDGFLYEIFNFFVIFLYLGIYAVPTLLLLSIILMVIVRKKHKNEDDGKTLNILTVGMPIFTAILMILTNFNSRLQ